VKVLVTGGAGYIGSHACKTLAAIGHEPIVYDNLSRGRRWAVKWGPFEEGDISDTARVIEVIERHQPVALMHFAAFTYVGESIIDPLLYYRNNVAATAALITAVVQTNMMPVVFSSTAAVYGIPQTTPIAEDHPIGPINPYGFSKHIIERMLADADRAYGLKSVSLRYFNVAGADPDGEIGEDHDPETHLIPLVLAAARDRTAVSIFGDDYATPDGTCIRDYIHVLDIASAHVAALGYLLAGNDTTVVNLANSRGYSVREVITMAEQVCGKSIEAMIGSRRTGDPAVLIGQSERARTSLNWQPVRSELRTQLAEAWTWMQRQASNRNRVTRATVRTESCHTSTV
jgi:UDP-glucose-4-epimerase GalE